ncbi:MAG: type II secretion system F family protein [Sulfuricurvum sp.]|uniref:type II secretion system F family protein n=1 Tax=Sulfuricurvum sp. TaxID=2025608 RepID=UPI0026206A4A|nr:type II secretion system F family protein [Sulfuricurvum sp.]MDD2369066.1 type II secretion system F family protein [Sulfuricurvum sp.]MDD2950925.1 type II secretion system F family protein [Sulfuricurvum sp.]MDD5116962.1 type II secretion system F family protein [Sulfuricurvum sp.]
MKFFRVRYKQGKHKRSSVFEAAHKAEALKKFRDKSLGVPVEVKEVSEPFSMKFERIKSRFTDPIQNRRVKDEPYIAFLDQLSTMLDAGMPINTCLSESITDTHDPMIRSIFTEVLRDIESGLSLSRAVVNYQRQLGTLSLSMFELGEQTGTLSTAIAKLSSIMQQIFDNRQKLKKATRYPLFILIAMSIAFTVVITFVVPQFQAFFEQSGMELPFPTKLLLWTEHAIRIYGPYIIGGAIILSVSFSLAYRRNPVLRLKTDQYFLKIFIVGKVTYYAMIGRFIYLFNVLTEAGIPMIDALNIAMGVVENNYIKQELQKIPTAIEDGRSLAQGFAESAQFEGMVMQMIKAGESSGSLGTMLGKVNRVYNSRYDYIVDNVATMIEPILIAAIAGFVLVLALGIFLPMWSMVDLAG